MKSVKLIQAAVIRLRRLSSQTQKDRLEKLEVTFSALNLLGVSRKFSGLGTRRDFTLSAELAKGTGKEKEFRRSRMFMFIILRKCQLELSLAKSLLVFIGTIIQRATTVA